MKRMMEMYKKNEEIINYLLVGGMTTIVAIGTKFAILFIFLNPKNGLHLQIAETISWLFAVSFAYIANRIMVFKSTTVGRDRLNEIVDFFKGRIFTQLLQMFIMWFFVTILKLNSNGMIILFTLICQIMQIVLNYVISKLFVFEKNEM